MARTALRRMRLLAPVCLAWVLGACTTASITTVALDVPSHAGQTFGVAPLGPAERQLVYTDWTKGFIILQLTGWYTYTFEEEDFETLRQSILKSVEGSGAFDAVQAVATPEEAPDGAAILTVEFAVAGVEMRGFAGETVVLQGTARLHDPHGAVVGEREITVEYAAGLKHATIGGMKEGAIEEFVLEVAALLGGSAAAEDG